MRNLITRLGIVLCVAVLFSCNQSEPDNSPRRLELLFLGHDSKHHESTVPAELLAREVFPSGINITYTSNPDDLNKDNLSRYDGLVLYANHDSITDAQAEALLGFVKNGKGFIPVHCASWCFRNNAEVVELIGGQFKTHKVDSFPSVILKPEHPAIKGQQNFTTFDETYVHDKLSKNIEVLMERVEGDHHEPYTWVRDYGKGRVFYTAYGHGAETWNNPGFMQLLKNGILWALGDDTKKRLEGFNIAKQEYSPAVIPNYEKRDPPPPFQAPLTPEQSMSLIQVPQGFELSLFAAEPDIKKPIYMNWDERGRLWLIETVDYPNTVKDDKEEGDDRIKILEDTDGDGRADKFTIFAEKLNIPTSFTFANDGIIVSQAPYFLFLKDTNGDDRADVKDTLITGWGVFDTHAGPNNLRYGFDNKIWGVLGYSAFNGVSGNSDTLKFGQGVYNFNADGSGLNFLGSTSNNTWGLGFSEDNDVFISTANNTHSAYYAIPKNYFDKVPGMNESGVEKIDGHYAMHVLTHYLRQVDVHGGFTAAAGHSLYTARNFPKEYWNRIAFVCEPTGRVIHNAILEQNGSSFKEKDGWNLLASSDDWVGPVQAEVGPDGSVWILDWYNFIIQHNPTPVGFENGKGNAYINPMRDTTRGRIYKLKYKKSQDDKILSLNKKNTGELVKALSNKNMFWRLTAQRLLVESGDTKAIPDLISLIKNSRADEIGINAPAIHALWTLHGLKALDGSNKEALAAAEEALKNPAAGVRRAALAVLPVTANTGALLRSTGVLEDADLRVRLAAILKSSDIDTDKELGSLLFKLASNEQNMKDKWLPKALQIASYKHMDGYLEAFREAGISDKPQLGEASLVQRIAMSSKLRSLQLNKWNNIGKDRAPDASNREILFSANVEMNPRDRFNGVILAHGDKQNGYAVYVQDDKLKFQVNQGGKSTVIGSADKAPDKYTLKAKLLSDGKMTLLIDDKEVATGKTKGLFTSAFNQGIRVGFDNQKGNDKAGSYDDDFRSGATINEARLEFMEPGGMVADLGKPDQVILLKPIQNAMKYDKTKLSVKAGTVVEIIFDNIDFMQHNVLILTPGSMDKVGAAADKLAQDPNGAAKQYIPDMPEVLFSTPLVNPENKYSLKFRVPAQKGDYPYICTFPGHWRIMNGIMEVR